MSEMKRTPDKWYYNLYKNGELIMSHGYHNKEQADHFLASIEHEIQIAERNGQKIDPSVEMKVEEAIGWSVKGKFFNDYNEALRYMWELYPLDACIKGVFKK